LTGDMNVHHTKWLRYSSHNTPHGQRLYNITQRHNPKKQAELYNTLTTHSPDILTPSRNSLSHPQLQPTGTTRPHRTPPPTRHH
jgi:hypothetical protein